MTSTPQRLTGRIKIHLPPGEAFHLFTPRGEQAWAHGWHPRFPAPAPDDTQARDTAAQLHQHGPQPRSLVRPAARPRARAGAQSLDVEILLRHGSNRLGLVLAGRPGGRGRA